MSSIRSLSGDRHVGRVHDVEADVRDEGAAVGRDAPGRRVGVVDRRDVRHVGELGQQRRDVALTAADVDRLVGADDDVDGVARLGGEPVLEQAPGRRWSPSPGAE